MRVADGSAERAPGVNARWRRTGGHDLLEAVEQGLGLEQVDARLEMRSTMRLELRLLLDLLLDEPLQELVAAVVVVRDGDGRHPSNCAATRPLRLEAPSGRARAAT